MWGEGSPHAPLVSAATIETRMSFARKSKNETVLLPSDSTSGDLSEETQNTNLKEHEHLYVHCSIICNHQDMEVAQCPSVDEWIKQLWDIYTMEYYLAVKKEPYLL